jgi:hypothetical protein
MSPATAGLLASLALVAHLLWILFVVFGGLVFLRFPWGRLVHLVAVGAALLMQWLELTCPLTLLEQEFLRQAGGTSYEGSFLIHYLERLVYPAIPLGVITALTVLLLVVTIVLLKVRPLRFSPRSL